jgi:hypothetical protein
MSSYRPAPEENGEYCILTPAQLRMNRALNKLHAKFNEQYGEPAVGTSRATHFVDDQTVAKIPLTCQDVDCNLAEANWTHAEIPIAKCEIKKHGIVPVLCMERVEPLFDHVAHNGKSPKVREYDNWPAWVYSLCDGPQIGKTQAGDIVAYDCGSQW